MNDIFRYAWYQERHALYKSVNGSFITYEKSPFWESTFQPAFINLMALKGFFFGFLASPRSPYGSWVNFSGWPSMSFLEILVSTWFWLGVPYGPGTPKPFCLAFSSGLLS